MKSNPQLPTKDIFDEAFQEYANSKLAETLNEKYRLKPYHEAYKGLKTTTLLSSYLFNLVSALAALYVVYAFIRELTSSFPEVVSVSVAFLVSLSVLILLEIKKRELFSKFIKGIYQFKKFYFGLFAVGVLVLSFSVTFSYYGGKAAITDFTPPPTVIQKDSAQVLLSAQLALLTTQIADARRTKWKGTTTTISQRTIETLSKEKLAIQNRLFAIETQKEKADGTIIMQHESELKLSAATFAGTTIVCEILFVLCMFYLEYYSFKSHATFALAGTSETLKSETLTPIETLKDARTSPVQGDLNVSGVETVKNETLTPIETVWTPANETVETLNLKNRRQIGFVNGKNETVNPVETVTKTVYVKENNSGICVNCKSIFKRQRKNKKYCSDDCRLDFHNKNRKSKG